MDQQSNLASWQREKSMYTLDLMVQKSGTQPLVILFLKKLDVKLLTKKPTKN